MTDAPWFKFYPSDWLAGTRGMTALEAGVYITLIAMMYDHAKPLTKDHARLARYCGATPRQFASAISRLIDDGKIIELPGGYFNTRVASELQEREEKICNAKRAGVASAEAKAKEKQGASSTGVEQALNGKATIPEARDQISEKKGIPNGIGGGGDPPIELAVKREELEEAVKLYNAMAKDAGLPQCQRLTDDRRKKLRQRLKECGGLDGWRVAMAKAAASPLITGKKTHWHGDFDFIVQSKSFTKLMEGSYDAKPAPANPIGKGGGFSAIDALDRQFELIKGGRG
jgi:uncharacterized protein YdaU (DUF1376 family)